LETDFMIRISGLRVLVAASGLALLCGCGGDDDDGNGTGDPFGRGLEREEEAVNVEFFDDFSGPFPGPNWIRKDGEPAPSLNAGNAPPGLFLLGVGTKHRVRGTHPFSTSSPLTLTFDLCDKQMQSNSRFKFTVRPASEGAGEASLEISMEDRVLRMETEDDSEEIPFSPFSHYMKVEFTIDSAGTAHWFLDGQEYLATANFPGGTAQIEFEVTGGSSTKFVVDNVKITRPVTE
jgi:hypothetical protein